MIHSLVRKRNALLTTVVLSALSLPAYAADADADPLQVKTDAIVVTASRTEQMLRESPASAERRISSRHSAWLPVLMYVRTGWSGISLPFAGLVRIRH